MKQCNHINYQNFLLADMKKLSHYLQHTSDSCIEIDTFFLLQKRWWQRRAPDMQIIRTCSCSTSRCRFVNEIAVNIMLHHKPRWIPPIIKDLRAHYMASDTPNTLIPFPPQPLMPQTLHIKIPHLKAAMMHMPLGPLKEEETVMIHFLPAPVEMQKRRHVFPSSGIVHELRSFEVKVRCVEGIGC